MKMEYPANEQILIFNVIAYNYKELQDINEIAEINW